MNNADSSAPQTPLALLAGAPRPAWRLDALLPVWGWFLATNWVWASCRSSVYGSLLAVALGAAGILVGAAWVGRISAGYAAAEPGRSPGVPRDFLPGLVPVFLGPLITLSIPAFLAAIALATAAAIGRLPGLYPWLLWAWLATGGLVLAFGAATWLLAAVAAVPLQVCAAVIDRSDSFEAVSRSLSYVRRRPLLLLGGWLAVAASSLIATAAFLVLVTVAQTLLIAMASAGVWGPSFLWGSAVEAARLWALPEAWGLPAGLFGPPAATGAIPFWLLPIARLVPAFLITSMLAGSARVYLLLRREVDGVGWGPGRPG